MKYLLLAAVAVGALFLAVGSPPTASATTCGTGLTAKTIASVSYCVPTACGGMTFDHAKIGTSGADLIRITGSGRWFIDGKGGDDFIAVQALNGPNCIVGGSGIDLITASPFHRDVCILNDGTTPNADAPTGSENAKDWAVNCKTATPSPLPSAE